MAGKPMVVACTYPSRNVAAMIALFVDMCTAVLTSSVEIIPAEIKIYVWLLIPSGRKSKAIPFQGNIPRFWARMKHCGDWCFRVVLSTWFLITQFHCVLAF